MIQLTEKDIELSEKLFKFLEQGAIYELGRGVTELVGMSASELHRMIAIFVEAGLLFERRSHDFVALPKAVDYFEGRISRNPIAELYEQQEKERKREESSEKRNNADSAMKVIELISSVGSAIIGLFYPKR